MCPFHSQFDSWAARRTPACRAVLVPAPAWLRRRSRLRMKESATVRRHSAHWLPEPELPPNRMRTQILRRRNALRKSCLIRIPRAFEFLTNILPCFFQRTLRIILGAHGLPVLIHRALALVGDVENLPEVDVRPDLGPLGLEVARERLAKFVRSRLVVVLQEEQLADPVVRQRAVAADVERLL